VSFQPSCDSSIVAKFVNSDEVVGPYDLLNQIIVPGAKHEIADCARRTMWVDEDGHAPPRADVIVREDTICAVFIQPIERYPASFPLLFGEVDGRFRPEGAANLRHVVLDSRRLRAVWRRDRHFRGQQDTERSGNKAPYHRSAHRTSPGLVDQTLPSRPHSR
jgi:hypothetical protein